MSPDPEAAFQQGLALEERGDYPGAAEAYEQAVGSGHLEATLNLALLYMDVLGRAEDAERLWQEAMERGDLRAMLDLGFSRWRGGDYRGAEIAFRQAIEAGHPRAHLEMGFLLADEERDEDALPSFQRAAAEGVDEAWTQIGWQLARLGRLEEAEEALRRAHRSGDLVSADILRDVLEASGRSEEATAVFQEAVERAANEVSLDYRELLAQLDGEGLYAEELEHWAREEGEGRTPLPLAALLFDAPRLAQAETRLKLAVGHGDPQATAALVELYEKTGRRNAALELMAGRN